MFEIQHHHNFAAFVWIEDVEELHPVVRHVISRYKLGPETGVVRRLKKVLGLAEVSVVYEDTTSVDVS